MRVFYDHSYSKVDYEEQAAIFRARYGYTLPVEYVRFLEENGSGSGPVPGYFERTCQIESICNLCFDETVNCTARVHVEYESSVENGWLSKNLLPIASAQGSHVIFCLVLSGPLYGQIIERQDDNVLIPEVYQRDTIDQLYIVADTMDDFISKLEYGDD